MREIVESLFENAVIMYMGIVFLSLFMIVFRIFVMLAVGFDCKARGIKNQAVWMVLTYVAPLIVGIIYLFLRDKEDVRLLKRCTMCGAVSDSRAPFCMQCRGNSFIPLDDQKNAYKSKSKLFFGISMCGIVGVIICLIVFFSGIFGMIFDVIDGAFESVESYYSENWDVKNAPFYSNEFFSDGNYGLFNYSRND